MNRPSARLFIQHGPSEFAVKLHAETTSLGSASDCTVSLRGDGIATRHCVIQATDDGHEVFDLFSPSGTFVNGRRIEAARLTHGDAIQIGAVRIRYLWPPEELPAPSVQSAVLAPSFPSAAQEPSFPSAAQEPSFQSAAQEPSFQSAAQELRPAPFVLPLLGEEEGGRHNESDTPPQANDSFSFDAYEKTFFDAQARAQAAPALGKEPHHRHGASFTDDFVRSLRGAPFFLFSLLVHAFVAILMHLFVHYEVRAEPKPAPIATWSEDVLADLEEERRIEQTEVLEPTLEPLEQEDPVLEESIDVKVSSPEDSAPIDAAKKEEDGLFGGQGEGLGQGRDGLGLDLDRTRPKRRQYEARVKELRRRGLEIAIVIDSTSSMGDVLTAASQEMGDLMMSLATIVPGYRLACITYRDDKRMDEFVTKLAPLDANHYRPLAFLDSLRPFGGGDVPEAVAAALRAATGDLDWGGEAERIIILVGDAPAHEAEQKMAEALCRRFSEKNGVVHTIVTRVGSGSLSRLDEDAQKSFSSLAQAGRGTATTLGDHRALMQSLLELAIGKEHKEALIAALSRIEASGELAFFRDAANAEDLQLLSGALRSDPPPAACARVLLSHPRPEHFELYTQILLDPKAPESSRWLVGILLGRLARTTVPPPRDLELARAFLPPAHRREQKRAITELASRLGQ